MQHLLKYIIINPTEILSTTSKHGRRKQYPRTAGQHDHQHRQAELQHRRADQRKHHPPDHHPLQRRQPGPQLRRSRGDNVGECSDGPQLQLGRRAEQAPTYDREDPGRYALDLPDPGPRSDLQHDAEPGDLRYTLQLRDPPKLAHLVPAQSHPALPSRTLRPPGTVLRRSPKPCTRSFLRTTHASPAL